MYAASNAFRNAVANDAPQIAMLIFKDAVLTDEDIDVEAGIEFDDNFNMDKDLAIGQITSNELRFTVINEDRLMNDYEFGECTATIGALIGTDTYTQAGSVMMNTNYAAYIGAETTPFLRRNGTAVPVQPSFAVKSLMGYGGKVWVFSGDGRYAVYNDATGANITADNPMNAFMIHKSLGWEGKGIFYNASSRILFVYEAGERRRYEFVPLGVFTADRPDVPDQIRVSMTCLDRMKKFETDMPSAEELGISYPITIGNLFAKMCTYLGVPYRTNSFLNSEATVDAEPDAFSSTTMRTVLGWIAEVAASNARFDRDGYLIMDWLRTTSQSYSERDYSEFEPFWYETPAVSKLYIRDTLTGTDTVIGNGNVEYLIQDNPLIT